MNIFPPYKSCLERRVHISLDSIVYFIAQIV